MRVVIILFGIFLSFWSFAQEDDNSVVEEAVVTVENAKDKLKVFEVFDVSKSAQFRPSAKDFYHFIFENIVYPKAALDSSQEGTVNLVFIVETDGTISDLHVLGKEKGFGLEEEALRIIALTSGEWSPAYIGKRKVRMRQRIPLSFRL